MPTCTHKYPLSLTHTNKSNTNPQSRTESTGELRHWRSIDLDLFSCSSDTLPLFVCLPTPHNNFSKTAESWRTLQLGRDFSARSRNPCRSEFEAFRKLEVACSDLAEKSRHLTWLAAVGLACIRYCSSVWCCSGCCMKNPPSHSTVTTASHTTWCITCNHIRLFCYKRANAKV